MPPNNNLLCGAIKPSREDYVKAIAKLPDLALDDFQQEHCIVLGAHNEKKIIRAYQHTYRIMAQWLEFYLLDNTEVLAELKFTRRGQIHKPGARLLYTTFLLIQEIWSYPLTKEVQNDWPQKNFDDHLHWWWLCECERCSYSLSEAGLIGEPRAMGKSEYAENTREWVDIVSDPRNLEIIRIPFTLTPLEALTHIAGAFSVLDLEFRNNCFYQYCKAKKQYANHIEKRCPELKKMHLLPDGSIEVVGDTRKKIPKALKGGFVTKT